MSINRTALDLPQMVGTEKQVAWATKIRDRFISDYNPSRESEAYSSATLGALEIVDSASFWIEHRSHGDDPELLAKFLRQTARKISTDYASQWEEDKNGRLYPFGFVPETPSSQPETFF